MKRKEFLKRKKEIEDSFKKSGPENKINKDTISLILSIVAILISLLALYFQFFYEKYDVIASSLDSSVELDTIISSKVIYQNKGNLDVSILKNKIYFSNKMDAPADSGIKFSKNCATRTFENDYDPIVLSPRQQFCREIRQPFSFKNLDTKKERIDSKDTVYVSLYIEYINSYGYSSFNQIEMGWILLDSTFACKKWGFNYKSVGLNSNLYYVGRYKKN